MTKDGINDTSIVDFLQSDALRSAFPAQATLEGYWDGLSEGKQIPFRSQLDPRAMEPVLEFAFVLERLAPGVCRFRLSGQHLNDLMGQEVRGMPATALFEPESRREISRLLEIVCTKASIVDVALKASGGFGRGALQGRLFLAPLRDDHGQITRILGCLQSHGSIGRQPRRFSVADVVEKLTDFPVNAPALPTVKSQNAFCEPKREFTHASQTAAVPALSGKPLDTAAPATYGLRLVVDNS